MTEKADYGDSKKKKKKSTVAQGWGEMYGWSTGDI